MVPCVLSVVGELDSPGGLIDIVAKIPLLAFRIWAMTTRKEWLARSNILGALRVADAMQNRMTVNAFFTCIAIGSQLFKL